MREKNDGLLTKRIFIQVSLLVGLLLGVSIMGLLARGTTEIKAQSRPNNQNVLTWPRKPQGKLSQRLEVLAQPAFSGLDIQTQTQILGVPLTGPGSISKNEAGEVLVYIRLRRVSAANLDALTKEGVKIVHIAEPYRTVTAFIGVSRLTGVAEMAAVESVLEVLTPFTSADFDQPEDRVPSGLASPYAQAGCGPATTTEGDTLLNAAAARAAYGLDGSGVTVGVVSNSYNNPSHPLSTTATVDIASGDLPGPGNPCGRTTPVNVIIEDPYAEIDEGRAMLQIVHDLAPGAKLAFASAQFGIFGFADNIRALRYNAGADIIVDDIGFYEEPFFQDGPVSVAIQEVTANGALHFTAAGNDHHVVNGQAVGSYEAPAYRPMACPALPQITQGGCHDFDPGPGADNSYSYTVAGQSQMTCVLDWAEPWYGVQTDFDLYLLDSSDNLIFADINNNLITQYPASGFIGFPNPNTQPITVSLVIHRHSGTATPRLKWIIFRSELSAAEYSAANSTDIFGPTIKGHSGEDTALSVATVPYTDTTTPQNYTSRGFPTYYFGPVVGATPAAPLPVPETRQKPDLAAIHGGRNTFFGRFESGVWRFYGTSAAAPHAAGVAALMKQRANQLERLLNQSIAESILETTASSIPFGSPQATGAGLVNALSATNSALYTIPFKKVYLPLLLKN